MQLTTTYMSKKLTPCAFMLIYRRVRKRVLGERGPTHLLQFGDPCRLLAFDLHEAHFGEVQAETRELLANVAKRSLGIIHKRGGSDDKACESE